MSTLLDPVTGPITRKQLQEFAESPIDNAERAAKIFTPLGKRSAKRGAKPVYENEFAPAVTAGEVRARRDSAKDKKLGQLLDYYAGTQTPFEDIATYLKVDLPTVIRVMKLRGRVQ